MPPRKKITVYEAFKHASKPAKAYAIIVAFHSILFIAMSITVLLSRELPDVYGYLAFFIAFCFIGFSWEGVLRENNIQLRCAIITAILITIYLGWFLSEHEKKDSANDKSDFHDIFFPTVTGLSGLFCITYLIIYRFVVNRFGWYRYNRVAIANEEILATYYVYQIYRSILWFDHEACFVLLILIMTELQHSSGGYILNILFGLYQLAWSFIGYYSIRKENITLIKVYFALSIGIFVYSILYLYWIATEKHWRGNVSIGQFVVSGLLSMITRVCLMYWAYRAVQNFDKGLKEKAFETGMDDMDFFEQDDKAEPFLGQGIEVNATNMNNDNHNFDQTRQKRLESSGFD